MSTNSKNKVFIIIVAILLLTNFTMLYFFLNNKEHGMRRGHDGREAMMSEFLQKEIGFNPQQLIQYDTLSKQHRESMKAIFEEAGKSKENHIKMLAAAGFSDSAINNTAEQSLRDQKMLEVSMFRYLKDLRGICTAAQQPVFDSLIYKVISRHGEGRKRSGDNK